MAEKIGYYPGADVRNNVISYLEDLRRSAPSRIAFKWAGLCGTEFPCEQISFGALAERIAKTSSGLLDLGVRPGERVLLFLPMGVELYTAMFAVQRIGAAAVFLDSWARRSQLGACARKAAPSAFITSAAAFALRAEVPELAQIPRWISDTPYAEATASLAELARAAETPIAPVASETSALITFTTGSSGAPKGANRTHRFLSAQHLALREVIPYHESDVDLTVFPIFCLNNLAGGVTTLIPAINLAAPAADDGAQLVRQMLSEGVSCATLSPSLFNAVSRTCVTEKAVLKTLRRVVTGGAPVSADSVRAFAKCAPQADQLILYGSTEVEPMAHITGSELLKNETADREHVAEGVRVGALHHALKAKLVRICKGPIAFSSWPELEIDPGGVGELVVSGEHVCRNYYNDEEAFARAKIRDGDGIVWHRTGDLARFDAQADVWIVGRVHNAILRGGNYYFPVRAEVLLKRISGVRRAAYLGLADAALGEKAVAALALETGSNAAQAAAEAARLCAKNNLPLDGLYVLDDLPMDPRHHSKVEYEILRNTLRAAGSVDILKGGA